jgi:type I restriction enzyme S subunit
MNKYSSYKDSELFWFKSVPKHWVKTKNKFVLVEKDDRVNENSNDFKLLSLTKKGIILRDIESGKGKFPESFDTYKIVTKEDVIFCLYDIEETPRTVGFSELDGMISGSYKIFGFTEKMIGKYFYYYFLHVDDEKGLKPFYTGLRNVVRPETFKSLDIFSPPLSEQQQIVSFLDGKTLKIDTLIQQKEKKIELLKEKRNSLINHVVTKGLNSNVEMKDSGVEWIGEIPSHWEITKFKYKGEVIIGLSYKPENLVDKGEGTLVMRSSNVQNGKPSFHDNVYVDCKISDKLKTREGDILICSRNGSRKLIGKNCLITKNIEGMSWGVFMTMYRTPNYKYFYWLLNSPVFKSQSGLFLTSTINQLTVSTLENMIVPYVNDENEQQQIVEYLDKQTEEIDTLIKLEQKKIDTLKEYRQSLISEVVTGKIRVCEEDNSLSLNSQTV